MKSFLEFNVYYLIISPKTVLVFEDFEMNDWASWAGDL